MKFSVLLSVYIKEQPAYLRQALESVFSQTLPPDEVVLVEDGPLTDELSAVVGEFAHRYPALKVVPLDANHGLGYALNIGLGHCTHELVARMDTDDVCKPNRFEVQVAFMDSHPDVDIVGSWIDEFLDNTGNVVSIRKVPESHQTIVKYGKMRNPMNHPTVMFRKEALLRVGSYKPFMLLEDYYLWARMIVSGCKFHNLQQSLLFFRLSRDIYRRRGGYNYAITEVKFQKELRRIGYLSKYQVVINILNRFFIRIMPVSLRGFVYKRCLRK